MDDGNVVRPPAEPQVGFVEVIQVQKRLDV